MKWAEKSNLLTAEVKPTAPTDGWSLQKVNTGLTPERGIENLNRIPLTYSRSRAAVFSLPTDSCCPYTGRCIPWYLPGPEHNLLQVDCGCILQPFCDFSPPYLRNTLCTRNFCFQICISQRSSGYFFHWITLHWCTAARWPKCVYGRDTLLLRWSHSFFLAQLSQYDPHVFLFPHISLVCDISVQIRCGTCNSISCAKLSISNFTA